MVEKKTGVPWETHIQQEVFTPLDLQSGGFGPPQDVNNELEQPRGHRSIFGFDFAVGTDSDNSPIMGPAGTLHLSLIDLAHFGHEHLKGKQGQGSLLTAESYQRLHHPSLSNYAYGWVVNAPDDIDAGTIIWHNGSNTYWYAMLAIMPSINAVVAVTSNDGNIEVAERSSRTIVKQLAKSLESSASEQLTIP